MDSTGGSSNRNNWIKDSEEFYVKFCARGIPICSFHINLDGQVGICLLNESGECGTEIPPEPTFELMAGKLYKLMSKHFVHGCVIGLVTDKHVADFVMRYGHRLFETGMLKYITYTFFDAEISYDELMLESSPLAQLDPTIDPSTGRKLLGQLKNWRVPAFFHDEIVSLGKPIFTLDVGLNGGVQVRFSSGMALAEIPPKPTMDLMAKELHKLICDYSVEGCIVLMERSGKLSEFVEKFTHRLFQTGKLRDVRYTLHPLVRPPDPKDL